MSFTDIFKNSFLQGFDTDISLSTIFTVLLVSLIMGIFVYLVYRLKNKNEFYNKDFANVLIGLPVITSAIVLSMQANIVVSLGMVGALSIVRFRNAVKSSMDLLYLFWSISIGMINGAQVYSITLALTALMTIIIIVLDFIPSTTNSLLVVMTLKSDTNLVDIKSLFTKYDHHSYVRSQVKSNDAIQCIFELKTKKQDELFNDLSKQESIESFNIILNDGANRLI